MISETIIDEDGNVLSCHESIKNNLIISISLDLHYNTDSFMAFTFSGEEEVEWLISKLNELKHLVK